MSENITLIEIKYKEGKRFIDETEPCMKNYTDIELSNIADIEERLGKILIKNAKAGEIVEGIERSEAIELLKWIVQRDREILDQHSIKFGGRGIKKDSLQGLCGLSVGIVTELLSNMGLQARVSNANLTIIGEGLAGVHGFSSVPIPVKENGEVKELNWLIDVTYRQLFLRDEGSERFIKDERFGNKVAPLAGYWCINLPGGKEFAHDILKNGFVELVSEKAKIYGDSFLLEKQKDKEYRAKYKEGVTIPMSTIKKLETGISGEQHMQNMLDENRQDYRGIDYDEGELEKYYGKLMQTPLMQKRELQKNEKEVLKSKELNPHDKEIDTQKGENLR